MEDEGQPGLGEGVEQMELVLVSDPLQRLLGLGHQIGRLGDA